MRTDLRMHIEYDEHIWTSLGQCLGHCTDYKRDLVRGRPPGEARFERIMPRHT